MFQKIRTAICVAKITALTNELIKDGYKIDVYFKGNALKSKYAWMALSNKIDPEVYKKLFRIEETDAQTHYLDLWAKEIKKAEARA